MAVPPFFDPSSPDTPAGMVPALGLSSISQVPGLGTGLEGLVYLPAEGEDLWSIGRLLELIATTSPAMGFTATEAPDWPQVVAMWRAQACVV